MAIVLISECGRKLATFWLGLRSFRYQEFRYKLKSFRRSRKRIKRRKIVFVWRTFRNFCSNRVTFGLMSTTGSIHTQLFCLLWKRNPSWGNSLSSCRHVISIDAFIYTSAFPRSKLTHFSATPPSCFSVFWFSAYKHDNKCTHE